MTTKEGDVSYAECDTSVYFPPRTTVYVATGRKLVLEGPKHESLLEITLEEEIVGTEFNEQINICVFVPVAVVANHLRQAGWTVTPPEAQLPSCAEQKSIR